jgi:hypothetical protein
MNPSNRVATARTAADDAQDSERTLPSQIPQSDAGIPSLDLPAESPAELIRNAASLLATASIGNRHARTFHTDDVLRVRQLLAKAVALLDPSRPIYVNGFGA